MRNGAEIIHFKTSESDLDPKPEKLCELGASKIRSVYYET